MDILLSGGRLIDPSSNVDASRDVLVREGKIAEVGRGLAEPSGGKTIDVSDRVLVPGLVDLHVHFREPGQEYKEDIETGSRSAAAGGFTTVCCMPNTRPVNDCRSVTDLIARRSREVGLARVHPIGAITKGLEGESLAEFGDMKEGGIVAVSDDGRPVMNAGIMRRALEYAKTFDLPLVQHAEDLHLAEGGVMNEGAASTRLGLRGQPSSAESVMVARDLELVEWTGARYHVAHVSAERTVKLVREAKRRGLPVSCEVTPHHFSLTDESCKSYDTATKVAPPLRTNRDIEAMKAAIADGTIDCIATDHAPHSEVEKDVEFDRAACGMLGLETALGLTLELVESGVIDLQAAIALLTSRPARLFRLDAGSLHPGAAADICIIDLDKTWVVDREAMVSRSANTPFHGRELRGAVSMTMLEGRAVYDPAGVLA